MFTFLANKPFAVALCLLSTAACGGQVNGGLARAPSSQSTAPAVHASVQQSSIETSAAAPPPDEPTESALARAARECPGTGCRPSKEIVSQLCGGKNPSVALTMFAANSPWQRSYIRVQQVDPLNTLGGPSSDEKLLFDEEVVVLDGITGAPNEMSVSGSNGHHVLRLDGTCATVMDDELTQRRPPAPRHAEPCWGHLDTSLQDALLEDPGVKKARRIQRVSCKGSWELNGDMVCENARQRLADAIVKAIQRPVTLPDMPIRQL